MSPQALQWLALSGACWTGLLAFARRGGRPGGMRFALGLGLGAVLAHAGWAVLHWRAVAIHPGAIIDLSTGYCVLFVPLGVLLCTRSPAAFRALPLAFAVARAGCLAAGCCRGPGGEPTPLYEMGGLLLLHAVVRRSADRWSVPAFCAGFGLVRLGVEPWRAPPPLGEPAIPPAWIAVAWVAAGIACACHERPCRSWSSRGRRRGSSDPWPRAGARRGRGTIRDRPGAPDGMLRASRNRSSVTFLWSTASDPCYPTPPGERVARGRPR
jgi:hypothetical protein